MHMYVNYHIDITQTEQNIQWNILNDTSMNIQRSSTFHVHI